MSLLIKRVWVNYSFFNFCNKKELHQEQPRLDELASAATMNLQVWVIKIANYFCMKVSRFFQQANILR